MFYVFKRVLALVYRYNNFKTIYFNFLLIISTFLEGLSIAVILPVLELFIDNERSNIINGKYSNNITCNSSYTA